jgi:hypothetical protein
MPQFLFHRKRISKFEVCETKEKYRIKCGTHHIQYVTGHIEKMESRVKNEKMNL